MSIPGPKSVFVSYSTPDRARADSLVAKIEASGVSCWIAPRDIPPGGKYAEAIMNGLETCGTFLLVFSKASNESQHVQREVERAINLKKKVVPVRIDEIMPTGSMDYYLATLQWIDAFGKEGPDHVVAFLGGATVAAPPPAPAVSRRKALVIGGSVVAAAGVGGLLHHFMGKVPVPPTPDAGNPTAKENWLALLDGETRRQLSAIPRNFNLEISIPGSSDPAFRLGEPIRFLLRSDRDVHVVVVVQSSDRSEVVVFPNTRNTATLIKAGQPLSLPGEGMELTAAEPTGTDVVFAVASTDPADLREFHTRAKAGQDGLPFKTFATPGTRGVIMSVSSPASTTRATGPDETPARSYAGLAFRILA